MSDTTGSTSQPQTQRLKKTVEITIGAIDALEDIQRHERRRTGKHKPVWEIIDEAIRTYAKAQGIQVQD